MHNARFKVLIMGHGEMSHAMQYLLGSRHDLAVWERAPRLGGGPVAPETLAVDRDVVLFCVPTPPHFDLVSRLLPALSHLTLCLSIAKGLDEQGRTPADIFNQVLGATTPHGVLHGPMIAEEIRAGKPAFAQLAVSDSDGLRKATALFKGTGLHIEAASDRVGVAWSAALKNVYAMLFGVADELRLGDNMRGHLAAGALAEISAIVTHFGGLAVTPYRLAGLGDLITTATSAGSHHHELGRLLVRGQGDAIHGEGIHTLDILRQRAAISPATYPLLGLIDTCVRDPNNIRAKVQSYLDALDRLNWAQIDQTGAGAPQNRNE